ncbi:phosphatidylserine/phosphatidylglycerophosphate/cardiolipin synthase family protein [Nonomuraea phyllanthi]|uniref:phospholipase D n=1 Tax=Nonomuraea phyllanthi TaxID=2219224 RepID=A0A5C4UZG1_9ACTN|nr:phospholipase D-like domain-containing protein [Nonomuraea phyllanthi]KAB8183572.1 phosphatidylserine/phosphatidylglycerophosphate/cardiolipin synthase family protein [Nonomuraea phyllanthi]
MPRIRSLRPAVLAGLTALTAMYGPMIAVPTAQASLTEPARSACRNAAEVPVETGAAFNDPVAGAATAVVERICSLIKQAPAGSSIEIAEFVVSGDAGDDYAAVLLDAYRRGVEVRIVIDGWQIDKPAAAELIRTLGTDESATSWVHVCSHVSPEGNTTSCQGTKGMHNKFSLFSETGGRHDVVVQASNNITDVNSTSYWNNLVVLPGNHKLFKGYGKYFDDLAAEVQNPDYDTTVTTGMRGGQVTAQFYPVADRDPIAQRLAQVGCKTEGRTRVEIGQSEWDATRLAIVDELAALVTAGCQVRVVHGPADDAVTAALDAAGVQRRVLDGSTPAGRVHSKYIVVTDPTGRGSGRGWVMTGSHNFNATSLRRNDEAMVEVSEHNIVEAYAANFARLWEVGVVAGK